LFGLLIGLSAMRAIAGAVVLFAAPLAGVFVGLLGGLVAAGAGIRELGGDAFTQHRAVLRKRERAGVVPHDYVGGFLTFAAGHVLLKWVGDGFCFMHNLLLDYFADLGSELEDDLMCMRGIAYC
jgi:hypothetical protein